MPAKPVSVLSIRLGTSFCYFISGENGGLLIDAGIHRKAFRLQSVLLAHERELSDIRLIILTHTHHDHVGAAADIKTKVNALIMVHAAEADFLRRGRTPLPNGTTPLTHVSVQIGRLLRYGRYEPVEPDILLHEAADLKPYGFDGYALPTPGHTIGSISVILGEKAFVGDTLIGPRNGKIYAPYLWNKKELKKSWRALLDTGCRMFYPGHGRPISRARLLAAYNAWDAES